jgi:tryptophan halogenase
MDETKAYDEVSQYYKELGITDNIQVGRKVKFGAGYVEEFWIKNCVQVGLSGIFVEPLEASSIGTSIQQVFALIPSLFFYERGETHSAKRYNDDMREVCKNIVDFIQLHYITKRDDSEFWRWCKNELVLTDFNKNNLEYFKEKFPNPIYFNKPMILFSFTNYAQIMHGLGMFNTEKIHQSYLQHLDHYTLWSEYAINDNNNLNGKQTFSHREAINILKERYLEIKHAF